MDETNPPKLPEALDLTENQFNRLISVGTPVRYYPVLHEEPFLEVKAFKCTRTRSGAWTLGDGSVVVKVEGCAGGVHVTHLTLDALSDNQRWYMFPVPDPFDVERIYQASLMADMGTAEYLTSAIMARVADDELKRTSGKRVEYAVGKTPLAPTKDDGEVIEWSRNCDWLLPTQTPRRLFLRLDLGWSDVWLIECNVTSTNDTARPMKGGMDLRLNFTENEVRVPRARV